MNEHIDAQITVPPPSGGHMGGPRPDPLFEGDAEISIKNPPLSQILLEKGTADAHIQSVATPFSQHQATRRDQSRPIAQ
jgi:hypothetical protein